MGRTAKSRRQLYEALRALEASARTARSKRGERYSRRDVAKHTGHRSLDRRLKEWLDDDTLPVLPAADEALRFAADALAGDGWHFALPALAYLEPEAVEKVRDIVFAHRGLEPSG